MKPGDIIEWVYKIDNTVVVHNEQCYSTTMKEWIPIGGSMLLISISDSVVCFLRKEGLFHARVDEAAPSSSSTSPVAVVPRARG